VHRNIDASPRPRVPMSIDRNVHGCMKIPASGIDDAVTRAPV
jgi:hypothetical protein